MRKYAPLASALALIVAAGTVHGLWTGRWSTADPLAEPAARLAALPANFGDWQGEEQTLDAKQQERAGIAGYVLRRYQNRRGGEQVTLFLLCGLPGPVSVHTPDVCYEGSGFARAGAVGEYRAGDAAFQVAEFREQNTPVPARLRVYWSWSADGTWQAPRFPRWTFARATVLYKLYAVRRTLRDDIADDTVPAFLAALMPELQKALFEATAPEASR